MEKNLCISVYTDFKVDPRGFKKEVEKRFNSFDEDIKHWNDYDYVLINKNLENCFKQIEKIISINKTKKINLAQIVR